MGAKDVPDVFYRRVFLLAAALSLEVVEDGSGPTHSNPNIRSKRPSHRIPLMHGRYCATHATPTAPVALHLLSRALCPPWY